MKRRDRRYCSPGRQPSKYELDRLAGRRLAPETYHVGGEQRSYSRQGSNGEAYSRQGSGECCRETNNRAGSRAGGGGEGTSRSSSRGGYRSDPEHEIEIQLQCIGGGGSREDDGSGESHRGYSVEDDEIVVVEEQVMELDNRQPYYAVPQSESRAHSRNGYKSDGSHGSTQESPLHPGKRDTGKREDHHGGYPGSRSARRMQQQQHQQQQQQHNLNNHVGGGQSHSATHLNAGYMMGGHPGQQRLVLHPTKHLEASRSFHTFQRQESATSFHSSHSAPSNQHGNGAAGQQLLVNNIESASQASTHSHSSSSSASMGPPEYGSLVHPPPSYDQALIKLDIAMRRRAQNKQHRQLQGKGAYNSLHYVGEFYG